MTVHHHTHTHISFGRVTQNSLYFLKEKKKILGSTFFKKSALPHPFHFLPFIFDSRFELNTVFPIFKKKKRG